MIPFAGMIASAIGAAVAMAKLNKNTQLAHSAMAGLSVAGSALGMAALGLGHIPFKPKLPGPKDWSPRRQRSCLCPHHSD